MDTLGQPDASSLFLITSVVAFVSISRESNERVGLKPIFTSARASSIQQPSTVTPGNLHSFQESDQG